MDTQTSDLPLRATARNWLVRLASREIAQEELQAFELWHDASAAHSEAFRIERDRWVALNGTRRVFQHAIAADTRPSRGRRFLWWPLTGALTTALALFVILADPLIAWRADHTSAVGEVTSFRLPDGSMARLNSDSALSVDFHGRERHIRLLRGEAWFDVERMPERPFVVEADGVKAVAKGTAFSVAMGDRAIGVAVTEGIVSVLRAGEVPVELLAGRRARLGAGSPPRVDAFFEKDVLAWRERKIVIDDLPLADAVREIDRYTPGLILFRAPRLDQPVSAILTFDRLDEGLDALAAGQGLEVVRLTPWLAIVH